MDTTKIDATLAWMAGKAEHIGEGMQMTGVTLIGMVVVFPAYTIMAKIGIPMYVIGKCISKFLKPNDKSDDIAPLPPVKDIKGGFAGMRMILSVAFASIALSTLIGCAMFKSAEHQILVDGHEVGRTIVKDGETLAQLPIYVLQRAATDDVYRAELLKDAVAAAAIAAN